MERRHRNNLRRCRQKIVEDLDVRDVVDKLIEEGIIDQECNEKILSELTHKARARRLLDTLPTRGPRAYQVFLAALSPNYCWLEEELEEAGRSGGRQGTQEILGELQEVLMKGGVPLPPSHYIARSGELKAIKAALCGLSRSEFLTIHGMPGSGKSVLAAHSVRDPEVTINHFPGGVFWFKVGMVKPTQLLNRLRALCMKLDAPVLPTSIEEAQEVLRKLFLSPPLSESLLILDDVWRPEVIKTFHLPARVLVTTQDVSVMDVVAGHFSVIEVGSGFTQEETLQLFASYVNVPVDALPEEAAAIHQECKGSPMVISMIGGLMSESGRSSSLQRQSGRWTHYLSSLKTRRYSKIRRSHSYEHDSVMEAVQMSIDNLPDEDRKKYRQLAVFLDDVPIPTNVLEVLWDLDTYEVEDTMASFIKKSMAVSEYDHCHGSFVYTVHDILLDYLKNLLKEDPASEKELHRHFLEQYFRSVNYRYGDLANDNYLFFYMGYHLHMARMTQLFPEIYLDLGYIEAVLKGVGTVELLSDYRKYGHLIAGPNGEHEEELVDFEEFARTVGVAVSSRPDADIIQLALRELETSAVYKAARRLADQRPETLYLEWSNRCRVQSQNVATILHPGTPCALKFLPDTSRVVTGTSEGVLKVWDLVSGEVLQKLPGHKGGVTSLALDRTDGGTDCSDRVCSGSEDGTIKIWTVAPMDDRESVSVSGQTDLTAIARRRSLKRKLSPALRSHKLETMTDLFGGSQDEEEDESVMTVVVGGHQDEGVLAVDWRPGREEVAVAGWSGTVWVYSLATGGGGGDKEVVQCGEARLVLAGHNDPVNCLTYDSAGVTLASGSDDCTVRLWDSDSGEFVASLNRHEVRVTSLAWLGGTGRLASMSSERLLVWNNPGVGVDVTILDRNRGTSWTCLAASDTAVAAGTAEDRMVIVWLADTGKVVAALPGDASPVTSLDFSNDSILLASTSDERLMVWSMEELECCEMVLSLGPPHQTRWLRDVPITAAPDDMNRITVLRGGEMDRQSAVVEEPVTVLQLSLDCSVVVFGTSGGLVKTYSAAGTIQLGSHDGMSVTSVAVTSDNKTVVSAGLDNTVRIFCDGTRRVCEGHTSPVRDVRLLAGNTRVVSCAMDGLLKVWSLATGELVLSVSSSWTPHATCLDVAEGPQGPVAAVAGVGGKVRVVELTQGVCLAEVGPGGGTCPARVGRFSPDGRMLVTGHDSGDVQVWDASTGLPLSSPLPLHSSWVTDARVSPDGSTLLTAGDRLVWWRLEPTLPQSPATPTRVRKTSLPLFRSRRNSGSRSQRASVDGDTLSCSFSALDTAFRARVKSGSRSQRASIDGDTTRSPASLNSPISKRKVAKVGSTGNRQQLQTFEIKGSGVSRVFVNDDFTQFVTLDDAGILYILDELLPTVPYS